jgi:hypothetical protein
LVSPLILTVDHQLSLSGRQLAQRMFAQLIPSSVSTLYIYVFVAVLAVMGMGDWNALFATRILTGAPCGACFSEAGWLTG